MLALLPSWAVSRVITCQATLTYATTPLLFTWLVGEVTASSFKREAASTRYICNVCRVRAFHHLCA